MPDDDGRCMARQMWPPDGVAMGLEHRTGERSSSPVLHSCRRNPKRAERSNAIGRAHLLAGTCRSCVCRFEERLME